MYKKTILTVAIHPEDVNPVFGESSTHISVQDDGGGPFIRLFQCNDETENGTVKLDLQELELVFEAAKELVSQFPKEEP